MKTAINLVLVFFLLTACNDQGLDAKRQKALDRINSKLINSEGQISTSLDQFYEYGDQRSRDSIAQVLFNLVSSDADILGMYLSSFTDIYYSDGFEFWEISADRRLLFSDKKHHKEMRIGAIGFNKGQGQNSDFKSTSVGQLNVNNFNKIESDVMFVRYRDEEQSVTFDLFYRLKERFDDKFEHGNWGTSNSITTGEPIKLETPR